MGMVFRVFIVWGLWDDGDVNRRQRVVVSLLVCLVAVVLAIVWPREQEPVYRGKKLSEWLVTEGWAEGYRSLNEKKEPDADVGEAVRQMGTNALPFLKRWIWYETPVWRKRLADTAYRVNQGLGSWCDGSKLYFRAVGAAEAFAVLGPLGKPVIPELAGVLRSTNSEAVERAVCVLNNIGLEAVPTLLAAVTNRAMRGPWTGHLRVAMSRLGTNASLVAPTVVGLLEDEDEMTATMAVYWLENMRGVAGVAPALGRSVRSPLVGVRLAAVRALGRFGEEGRAEAPALVHALSDPDIMVRKVATNALGHVAREMLGKGGER
jgi:HEAT repeats